MTYKVEPGHAGHGVLVPIGTENLCQARPGRMYICYFNLENCVHIQPLWRSGTGEFLSTFFSNQKLIPSSVALVHRWKSFKLFPLPAMRRSQVQFLLEAFVFSPFLLGFFFNFLYTRSLGKHSLSLPEPRVGSLIWTPLPDYLTSPSAVICTGGAILYSPS